MYRKIEDFQRFFEYETSETLRILNGLTDQSLNQKITPDGRSLGFLAWHIIATFGEMFGLAGIKIECPGSESEVPKSVSEIAAEYEKVTRAVAEELPKLWTDENLTDEIPMYGETWTKGFTLSCLLMHQTHHRGQMTVLMRQAGLKVHGVYGPAKEEWAEMGMPAMA